MAKPPKTVVPGLNRGSGIKGGYIVGRLPNTGKGPAQLMDLTALRKVGLATAAGVTQSTSTAISIAASEVASLSSAVSAAISNVKGGNAFTILGMDGIDGEDGAPIPGPKGATGNTGATGPQGPVGFALDGEDGQDGISIPGTPGAAGTPGATGATGPQGPVGFGLDGADGDDGMTVPGTPGAPGATGSTGPAGATGPQGPIGFGLDGADGDDGLTVPGTPGAPGTAGATGATGATGPQGPIGLGLDGADGDDGMPIPGPQGPTGATGATGPQGPAGTGGGGSTIPGMDGMDGDDGFALPIAPTIVVTAGLVQIGQVVGSGASGTVTFSNIPQTFSDLILVISGRCTAAATENVNITLNGVTGTSYDQQRRYSSGGSANLSCDQTLGGAGWGASSNGIFQLPGTNATTGFISGGKMEILGYSQTSLFKTMIALTRIINGLTDGSQYVMDASGQFRSTSAITSLTAALAAGNFATGALVTLYGRS